MGVTRIIIAEHDVVLGVHADGSYDVVKGAELIATAARGEILQDFRVAVVPVGNLTRWRAENSKLS